ncbi:MAG: hypothetical protein KatS3mg003_1004 [Candidatus Nitrosocaldaceae archaeon]|nr:MAG: hypothetical protein KatS3mg003_1004 [Candidatus Nitrosocaldaceae archaeon]
MCKYTAIYYDYELNYLAKYKCPHPAKVDGYCIFHAEDYWREHEEEVRDEFYKLVESAITDQKPLLCIGFNLPSFDFKPLKKKGLKIEFKKPVYFSSASFQAEADFNFASFQAADFSSASFQAEADFNFASFQAEADFNFASFQAEAYFSSASFQAEAYFSSASFQAKAYFRSASFQAADFSYASFQAADFSYASFQAADFSSASFQAEADFTNTDFQDEVEFINTKFYPYLFRWNNDKEIEEALKRFNIIGKIEKHNNTIIVNGQIVIDLEKRILRADKEYKLSIKNEDNNKIIYLKYDDIPIKFDYSTFRKRVRFIGEANDQLSLEAVSFKGVDLTNVEFHNVKWKEKRRLKGLISRKIIIDEEFLDVYKNYEEVSKIYNQLRKNYESRLLFNEASNFFIGEMEAIRKGLENDHGLRKLRSIPYLLYKWIAMYGESASLPLIVWTPIAIGSFLALRIVMNCNPNDITCINQQAIDGIRAYFQFPKLDDNIGVIERLISVPFLASAFIALKRKFERRK